MTYGGVTEQHPTGETCRACDCEVVVSDSGAILLLECDCGSVSALAPDLPSAA